LWGCGGFGNDQFKMKEGEDCKVYRVWMSKQEKREMGGRKKRARYDMDDDEDSDGDEGPRKRVSIEVGKIELDGEKWTDSYRIIIQTSFFILSGFI
jgi:hypothetical protein